MTELSGILLVTVVLALLFDFSNGWHDCANAVATVVSTRVLSPVAAVLLAGVLNVAGAFFSTAVAKMIGGGVVFPDAITNTVVAGAMGGAILWNFFTLMLGLPTSSSHALIGGLVGSAVAHGGWSVVQFNGLRKILEAMVLSPPLGIRDRISPDGPGQLGVFSSSSRCGDQSIQSTPNRFGQLHGIQPWGKRCSESDGCHYTCSRNVRSVDIIGSADVGHRGLRAGDGARNHGGRVADHSDSRDQDGETRAGSRILG